DHRKNNTEQLVGNIFSIYLFLKIRITNLMNRVY
ncbi:unnamed protein product, partial [Amoebophrya sp. A25]